MLTISEPFKGENCDCRCVAYDQVSYHNCLRAYDTNSHLLKVYRPFKAESLVCHLLILHQVSYDNCLRAYDTVTAVLKYEWENESRCHFTGLEVDIEFGEVRGPGEGQAEGEWLMGVGGNEVSGVARAAATQQAWRWTLSLGR